MRKTVLSKVYPKQLVRVCINDRNQSLVFCHKLIFHVFGSSSRDDDDDDGDDADDDDDDRMINVIDTTSEGFRWKSGGSTFGNTAH